MLKLNILLFDGFETLDVFGPVEVFGQLADQYDIEYYSEQGGIVVSTQKVHINTLPLAKLAINDILFIPGGQGIRREVNNIELIATIKTLAKAARYVLTVCTGTALLAKTGLLDNKAATTNKLVFEWVASQATDVKWQKSARWVQDDKYYTSSGVSAGIDMALGFIGETQGLQKAEKIAREIEYVWQQDKENDPFAV